jgi:arginine decarboxylase
MSDGRWVLLIASELGGTNSVSDRAMDRLCDAITAEGYEVIRTSTPEDGLSMVQSDPSYSAILLDWDLEQEHQFDERAALKIIRAVRRRNKRVPIFLIADRTLVSELPLEVIKQVHEYIHLFGDTPAFIANRVDFAVDRYNEQLLPPYFRELKKYTDQGAYSWDAPGHMGGVAFLKHPVGMQFHRFFGENLLRADLGFVARSHRPSGRIGAQRRAHLWRGLDVLRLGRLLLFEPDRRPWGYW